MTEKEPTDRPTSNSTEPTEPIQGPNPELYEKMKTPFDSQENANLALGIFLRGVQDLRQACKIPEVLVIASCNFKAEEDTNSDSIIQALTLGHQDSRAELAALAYQQYVLPEITRITRLQQIAQGSTAKPVRSRQPRKTPKK